jgi:PAS domain S-box-containing protein
MNCGPAFLALLAYLADENDVARSSQWELVALWMRLLNENEGMMREIIAKRLRSLRSLYIDVPALRPGTVGAYAFAFVSVAVATALRVALDPYVEGVQFITFYPAIVVTTVISGFGAGFLCTVLSTAAADFFVLAPRWSFNVGDPVIVAELLLFGPLASYLVLIIAQMRSAIERDQAEANKDRLQLALDASQLGWWEYDLVNGVALWSDRRSKEIYDVAEDKTDIEEFTKRVHPDDVEGAWAAMEAALDPTDPKPYAIEYRVQRGDGEVRCVEAHGLTYFEGGPVERRAVSMVGTCQDITERKRGEEERKEHEERLHLLMREVNHRARNMLGVVDAIAHQTVAGSPEDYVERFSERIRALAAYQDLLVRSEWKGVEIEDLARTQLSHFAALIGSRIAMRGPKLRLNAASAQAIGLALHELTTNAGKYGALSKDTGGLDVGWGTDGDTFTMSWTEHDGPQVSPPQQRGFGTVVMQEMAERSVDGKVDLGYAPSGVTWRLTCPAVNALELTA